MTKNGIERSTGKPHSDVPHFDDRRMELLIGRLLQTGVTVAALIVFVGGVMYLATHAHTTPDYRTFRGVAPGLRSPRQMLPLLRKGDSAAIMQLGVFLLVATPIARVVFAVVGFAIERDRMYTVVSAIVLAVLLISLFR